LVFLISSGRALGPPVLATGRLAPFRWKAFRWMSIFLSRDPQDWQAPESNLELLLESN
jgi:hypothetical protein